MTSLPESPPEKRLGLVIDLDTCVGCHACVVSCKEWNTGGHPAPLSDLNPYDRGQTGEYERRREDQGADQWHLSEETTVDNFLVGRERIMSGCPQNHRPYDQAEQQGQNRNE